MSAQQPSLSTLTLPWWKNLFWKSILWKTSACGAFACINGVARYLSGGSPIHLNNPLPVSTIIFFQNIFAAIFIFLLFNKEHKKIFTSTNLPLHLSRAVFGVIGVTFWYLTLKYFPIAQSVALSFVGPILTILGSIILLKEKLNISRVLAITCSFIGTFLILNDKYVIINNYTLSFAALFPIASSSCFVFCKLLTRHLALNGESPEKLTIYFLLLMIPVSGIFALMDWQTPHISHLPWLLVIGFLVIFAHFSYNKAYALADVTYLMPFGFTKFLLSMLVGYLAFSELPASFNIWLGLSTISLSLFILSLRSEKT